MSQTQREHALHEERRIAGDFLAGTVIFLGSLYTLIEAVRMPYYGDAGALSSPGLTPGLISLLLLGLSGALILRSRQVRLHIGLWHWTVESRRVLVTFGLIFAYVLVMPWVGYAPATFAMLFAFQLVFSDRRGLVNFLVWTVGLSAVLTGALYYVFAEIFFVPLP